MRPPRYGLLLATLLVVATGIAACSSRQVHSRLVIGKTAFEKEVAKNLRGAKLYHEFSTLMIVDALRLDRPLYDLWIEEQERAKTLSEKARSDMITRQEEILGGGEVYIIALYTDDLDWNDLDHLESHWALALKRDGATATPSEIRRIDLEKLIIRESLPFDPRFRLFYLATFPKTESSAGDARLAIASLLGSVELAW